MLWGILQMVLFLLIIIFPTAFAIYMLKSIKHADKTGDGVTHQCPYCGCIFMDSRLFHAHVFQYIVLKCPDCGKLFFEKRF
ncbi:MAG: hypothetical protein ABF449_07190 [Ethanoligenens sp.]